MHIWGEIWRPPHRISLVVGVDVDPKNENFTIFYQVLEV